MTERWDPEEYNLIQSMTRCKNAAPRRHVEISDRMFETLNSFLSAEYDGGYADDFKICDLKRIDETTYAVSFQRVGGGAGAFIEVWIGVVTWDDGRAEWELHAVKQTERESHA